MTLVLPACRYFHLEEFAVSSAHPELVEPVPQILQARLERLVRDVLCPLRERLGFPFVILSGYRSDALNAAVGGSPTSQHRFAEAADVTCRSPGLLYETVKQWSPPLPIGQVIYYPTRRFVHLALPNVRHPHPQFFLSRAPKQYERDDS